MEVAIVAFILRVVVEFRVVGLGFDWVWTCGVLKMVEGTVDRKPTVGKTKEIQMKFVFLCFAVDDIVDQGTYRRLFIHHSQSCGHESQIPRVSRYSIPASQAWLVA